jgi:N-methylhydantoinase B/oxoprolinase/acetone carboxylase alpha subunit
MDRIPAAVDLDLPEDLMLNAARARAVIELGMNVDGHTVTHAILRSLAEAAAEREIAQGTTIWHRWRTAAGDRVGAAVAGWDQLILTDGRSLPT